MDFEIVFDREEDGRWIAAIESLPGGMVYGSSRLEAQSKVLALCA
jgi:predicted RNase H-like HicB family nuclease